ncbi:hypothetical protein M011DRAFT_220607 [Sporormia fimetaria CBS 119925]|uniref:Uncharacterized protein n=1 Tax=Sporormia fimetaria CBS 119925 TaxID=1340428 RepID=A0A6A6UYP5_9PLEO|nr:hypothetical protein M011DRAFT_220607 [Sporormia fimetaria CBS 119925]
MRRVDDRILCSRCECRGRGGWRGLCPTKQESDERSNRSAVGMSQCGIVGAVTTHPNGMAMSVTVLRSGKDWLRRSEGTATLLSAAVTGRGAPPHHQPWSSVDRRVGRHLRSDMHARPSQHKRTTHCTLWKFGERRAPCAGFLPLLQTGSSSSFLDLTPFREGDPARKRRRQQHDPFVTLISGR